MMWFIFIFLKSLNHASEVYFLFINLKNAWFKDNSSVWSSITFHSLIIYKEDQTLDTDLETRN